MYRNRPITRLRRLASTCVVLATVAILCADARAWAADDWDAVTPNDLDLAAFRGLPSSAVIYRTTADDAVNLQKGSIRLSSKSHIVDQLPIRSVTTYVIDGVTPLAAPSDRIRPHSRRGRGHRASRASSREDNRENDSARASRGRVFIQPWSFSNMRKCPRDVCSYQEPTSDAAAL